MLNAFHTCCLLGKITITEDTPIIIMLSLLVLIPAIVYTRRAFNAAYTKKIFQLIHDGKGERFVEILGRDIETAISSSVRSRLELKLGLGLLMMGRWKEARTALCLIDSNYIQVNSRRWFHMGMLQVFLHADLEEANRYYVRNHDHFVPDSPKKLINQALRLHNGIMEHLIHQDPHAEVVFKAVSQECEDPVIKSQALYFLARFEHDRGATAKAEALFRQSKEVAPHLVHGTDPGEPWILRGRAARKNA